jgi:hypothetical protein
VRKFKGPNVNYYTCSTERQKNGLPGEEAFNALTRGNGTIERASNKQVLFAENRNYSSNSGTTPDQWGPDGKIPAVNPKSIKIDELSTFLGNSKI